MTFLIDRPHRGPREATGFPFDGDATRRASPDATDRELARALYVRRNVHGWRTERWRHDAGCRSWLEFERDTRTDVIRRIGRPEERDPEAVTT